MKRSNQQIVSGPTPSRTIPPYRRNLTLLAAYRQVPIVRVNDLPAPPPEAAPVPRLRPHSPPPIGPNPMFVPARFLHPSRYPPSYSAVESTSEDSSPQDRGSDFFFIRGKAELKILFDFFSVRPSLSGS